MSKRTVAMALVAAVVLGAGSYASAQGQPGGPSVDRSQDPPATAAGRARNPLARARARGGPAFLRRAVHGDLLVRARDGFQTVSFDRGSVAAGTNDHTVVLRRPDGTTVTKSVTGDTRFRGVRSAAQLKIGRPAVVVSRGGTALLVGQRPGNFSGQAGVPPGEEQVPAA